MKRILITGKTSYVGTNLKTWLSLYPEKYTVDMISVRDDSWENRDFSKYDVVFHAAGVAHVSGSSKMEQYYYSVNRDLTVDVATKCKADGVKQFIFMSSIIVYADNKLTDGLIDENTIPQPKNFYGRSKLQAEEGILPLESEDFKIVIIRPPMIYGKDSKGNYPRLAKIARKLPVFPDVDNKRSMLHIENLTEFVKIVIDNEERGLFFPQNKEFVKTSEMVRMISEIHGKPIKLIKFLNPILYLLRNRIRIMNKVFGDLVYDKKLSIHPENYQIRNLKESISLTER